MKCPEKANPSCRLVISRDWNKVEYEVTAKGYDISPFSDEKCSKIRCGDVCTTLWIY